MANMLSVINIRNAPAGWQHNPKYLYIGRAGQGMDGTFGNPFPLTNESMRNEVLDQYRVWLSMDGQAPLRHRIDNINPGTILVCFCKPRVCHGDVILDYYMTGSTRP